MRLPLEKTRARLAAVPRTRDDLERLRFHAPHWMTSKDGLRPQIEHQAKLLTEGELHWGFVHRANGSLFGPYGGPAAPGTVIHGDDAVLDRSPHRLEWASTTLHQGASGPEPRDPVAKRVVSYLADELDRATFVPLPTAWTEGLPLFMSTVLIVRERLPERRLTSSYVPLLVHHEARSVMLLPSELWTRDLAAAMAGLSVC
jgi:hypothetical protein